jgi:hypothetical protein
VSIRLLETLLRNAGETSLEKMRHGVSRNEAMFGIWRRKGKRHRGKGEAVLNLGAGKG